MKKYRSFVDQLKAKGPSCLPKQVISTAIFLEEYENISKKLLLEAALSSILFPHSPLH